MGVDSYYDPEKNSYLAEHKSELLNFALHMIEDGIHIIDDRGITVFYSKASERIEKEKAEDIVGKHIMETYQLNDESSILLKALKTREPIRNHHNNYLTKKGSKVDIITNTFPVFAGNRLIGAVSINTDITSNKQLVNTIINLQKQLFKSASKNGTRFSFQDIVGISPAIEKAIQFARKIAVNMSPLLIYGETGTGKELFAQSIHNCSLQFRGPFVAVNCAAIPATLLESVLFGTQKGAFTGAEDKVGLFEEADQGTLFLDEISAMDISLQSKLLRVLESKTIRRLGGKNDISVNPRIISAINIDPAEAIKKNYLRQDLYYRLAVVTLNIPPLRERMADIPVLTRFFIENINKVMNKDVKDISPEVADLFCRHHWPGNVRELQHAVEHALNYADEIDENIQLSHIPPHLLQKYATGSARSSRYVNSVKSTGNLKELLWQIETNIIQETMQECGGNITRAANTLGMSRQNLQQRLKRLGIKGGAD